MNLSRLFTYIIPYDDGAAPNPFNEICTLAICKPAIRRVAQIGDWIAGVGSKRARLDGFLVYAMKVTEILTLREYDEQAQLRWPHRIPDWEAIDLSRKLGDCIYDYSALDSKGRPRQRPGVHNGGDIDRDCGGRNVLISNHFYYFGGQARLLPPDLANKICPITQGHRSTSNQPHLQVFLNWLDGEKLKIGQLGWPDHVINLQNTSCNECSLHNLDDDETEESGSPSALNEAAFLLATQNRSKSLNF